VCDPTLPSKGSRNCAKCIRHAITVFSSLLHILYSSGTLYLAPYNIHTLYSIFIYWSISATCQQHSIGPSYIYSSIRSVLTFQWIEGRPCWSSGTTAHLGMLILYIVFLLYPPVPYAHEHVHSHTGSVSCWMWWAQWLLLSSSFGFPIRSAVKLSCKRITSDTFCPARICQEASYSLYHYSKRRGAISSSQWQNKRKERKE
jgi:hypothetical protein